MSEPLNNHPLHGGQLYVYAEHYHIPMTEWLDLSTGINPNGFPLPQLHENVLRDLPSDNDGLEKAACNYYSCDNLLMVPGSSWAIQQLPFILDQFSPHINTILLPRIGYKEHEKAWSLLKPDLIFYDDVPSDEQLTNCDVCVLINPNNPTAKLLSSERVVKIAQLLKQSQGFLIIDEAFMDALNQHSVASYQLKNVIVLRSLGKFFGLAGLRVGSVIADDEILKLFEKQLPPWPISHPARFISQCALQDINWINETKLTLAKQSLQLKSLCEAVLRPVFSDCKVVFNPLFVTIWFSLKTDATRFHHLLCEQGILTRLLDEQSGIRIGLANNDKDCERLKNAMQQTIDYIREEITEC